MSIALLMMMMMTIFAAFQFLLVYHFLRDNFAIVRPTNPGENIDE